MDKRIDSLIDQFHKNYTGNRYDIETLLIEYSGLVYASNRRIIEISSDKHESQPTPRKIIKTKWVEKKPLQEN